MKKMWPWAIVAVLMIAVIVTFKIAQNKKNKLGRGIAAPSAPAAPMAPAERRPVASEEKAPAQDVVTSEPEWQSTDEARPDILQDTLPAKKSVYVTGFFNNEVKWQVIKTLRDNGFSIAPKRSSKPDLILELKLERIGASYVCTAFLYDQKGDIVAQGRGESSYATSKFSAENLRARSDASVDAAKLAIEELMSDQEEAAE